MSLSELWLEKYKPKKYYELLTEERSNREILQWLKSWDELVFNKNTINNVFTNKPNHEFSILNNNQQSLNYYEKHLQELTYKKHKYIIIAGPPGLGKTTLAQVLSTHCGYDYHVINASDERTSESLIMKIENATKIHNLKISQGISKKPTCLILDEIDGINFGSNSTSNVSKNIVDFIKSGGLLLTGNKAVKGGNLKPKKTNKPNLGGFQKKKTRKTSEDFDKNSSNANMSNNDSDDEEPLEVSFEELNIGTKKEKDIIMRPIICICNDLYSRSIATLKKDALIFNIKKVDQKKLLNRLLNINKQEKLNLPEFFINSIITYANSDIRSCLNIMHLLSFQKETIIKFDYENLDELVLIGQKDVNQNIFLVWKLIFSENINTFSSQINNTTRMQLLSSIYGNNYFASRKENFYNILLDQYYSVGDFELVNDGLFHNYLNNPRFDRAHSNSITNNSYNNNPIKHRNYNNSSKLETIKEEQYNGDFVLFDQATMDELDTLVKLTECFSFVDRIQQFNKENHDYILPGMMINNCCKSGSYSSSNNKNIANNRTRTVESNFQIEFPITITGLRTRNLRNLNIFRSILSNYIFETADYLSDKEFIIGLLPALSKLIIPNIRELSIELLTREEQKILLLSAMICINLGLKIKTNEDTYELFPNVFELVDFNIALKDNKEAKFEDLEKNKNIRKMLILSREVDRIHGLRNLLKLTDEKCLDCIREDKELLYFYPSSSDKFKFQNANQLNEINQTSNKNDSIVNKIFSNNKHFIESNPKKNLLNNQFLDVTKFAKKRTTEDIRKEFQSYIFTIKFHEGASNSVKRKLKFDYFLK